MGEKVYRICLRCNFSAEGTFPVFSGDTSIINSRPFENMYRFLKLLFVKKPPNQLISYFGID